MSNAGKWMEDEANYFALCLLMPEKLVREEVAKVEWDLASDDALKYMARTFGVSLTAMAVRLCDLDILKIRIKS